MAQIKRAKDETQGIEQRGEAIRQDEQLNLPASAPRSAEFGIRGRRERQRGALKGLNERQLATGLGWFSIGLGLIGIAAPRGLSRLIGTRGKYSGLLRLLGARELASGIGILSQRRPTGAAWSRVGGDAIDLALLGAAFASPRAKRGRLTAATAAVAGVTALDVICSRELGRRSSATAPGGAMRVAQAVTINRSPEELYKFWRNFQNLPRFMKHLESVEVGRATRQTASGMREEITGDKYSHWIAKAPAGMTVEWDAEIIEDRPNQMIAWRSLEGADVDHMGSVRFEHAPSTRGTIVRARLQYSPPAGVIGASIARLFGEDPNWQVKDDLRRFKQIMEAGEILTTEGQPAGRAPSTSWLYDTTSRK
jgi:uncharacterized membrane protein